jgi:hypothetical protein
MVLDGGIDRGLVKDAILVEVSDGAVDLGQQRRHLRRVLLRAFRHRGRDNLPLGIYPKVQFLLAFGLLFPVLLGMPCALGTDLQATAVHDQGYRSLSGTIALLSDRHESGDATSPGLWEFPLTPTSPFSGSREQPGSGCVSLVNDGPGVKVSPRLHYSHTPQTGVGALKADAAWRSICSPVRPWSP